MFDNRAFHSSAIVGKKLFPNVFDGQILKFADDTKLFRKVKEIGDKQNLQDDIDKLVKSLKWSEKWQMLFNFGKCKCLQHRAGKYGHELRV